MTRPVLMVVLLTTSCSWTLNLDGVERNKLVKIIRMDLEMNEESEMRRILGHQGETNSTDQDQGYGIIALRSHTSIRERALSYLNKKIDSLSFEIHLPGYQYCGPGTNVDERITEGQHGINKLDNACLEHDKVYSKSTNDKIRADADSKLAKEAYRIYMSADLSSSQRWNAYVVAKIMSAKYRIFAGDEKIE